MTTVAFDSKILAADKLALSGNLKRVTTKIIRHENMRMGICGTLSTGAALFEWARNGFNPDEFPEAAKDEDDGTHLVVVKDGVPGVFLYEGVPTPIHFEGPYFAMGSGAHVATTAMHLGKSAVEAIELASELTSGSGKGVDYLD